MSSWGGDGFHVVDESYEYEYGHPGQRAIKQESQDDVEGWNANDDVNLAAANNDPFETQLMMTVKEEEGGQVWNAKREEKMEEEEDDNNNNNNNSQSVSVDGIGLFKSWRDSYDNPKYACLDLLDNCFDATMPKQDDDVSSSSSFKGKVALHYLPPAGFVIINNSLRPIKPLASTMTAYRSEKSSRDAIGEYGVGLKQAVATLSNCNFVLTRQGYDFQLGIISSKLQTQNRVNLPHFSFSVDPTAASSPELLRQALKKSIVNILRTNPDILNLAVSELAADDSEPASAVRSLVQRCEQMLDDEWKPCDRVFQVVICNLLHTLSESTRTTSGIHQHPTRRFLREIREMLPKYYINIPPKGFDFFVEEERVLFTYWQNRLVEMTKFQVNVPKDTPIQNMDDDSNWQRQGYDLSIYCGFDALRVADHKNQALTCQLCVYSRQSGRLIEIEHDARNMLGMSSSGVDFSQGLTVIVDDAGGNLPLKPTKDGLTWSKESHGEIHKSNLLAWVGAVGYHYWKHHCAHFEKMDTKYKTILKQKVLSFVEPITERLEQEKVLAYSECTDDDITWNMERLEKAKFTMFSEVTWKKVVSSNSKKLTIRKTMRRLDAVPGPATLFRFGCDIQRSAPAGRPRRERPKKRKSSFTFGSIDPQRAMKRQRQQQQQQSSPYESDSSSGSEEEELGDLEVAATTNIPNDGIDIVTEQSARVAELEQELSDSKEREKRLEAELRTAKLKLVYHQPRSRAEGPCPDDSIDRQQYQALQQQNEQLRQEKAKVENDLQVLKGGTNYENGNERLKREVEMLKLKVKQQETLIRRLQGSDSLF